MLKVRIQHVRTVQFSLKDVRTEDVYETLGRVTNGALYLFMQRWFRIEKYHIIQQLPHTCAQLHWRSPPAQFDIWEQSQLIHINVGKTHAIQCYVQAPDTPLQHVYDAAKRWAAANDILCANSFIDHETGQLLDLSQMLLDVYTRTFEIQ